ncbi:MAG: tRNA 2-thiouridine(34) synthase MnmA, partial [Clostridia bacterium]|nr:tRNA 2-thiouridine(34) synthase MnmA [Clostridia bacterium]
TPGQRRGLGIGGGGTGERWFVVGKDVPRNILYVSQGEPDELFTGSALADEPTWIAGHAPVEDGVEYACKVRLRHRQPLQECVIVLEGDKIHMRFPVKQRAVTPGQAAVLYQGDVCLGGGTILSDRDE